MENTAKNFALQLGSLIALYVSIVSLLTLLFGIITVAYPDAADGYWIYEAAGQQIRFSIAVLIVFFPTYLLLTRLVNNIRRNEHGAYLTLTKWLLYLSLLIGGVVILGDLVAIINAFLNGDIAIRFVLKALSVLVVVGAAFTYYALDAKGYWQKNEKKSIQYGAASLIIVIAIIVLGFFHTETPEAVRDMRIDEQQVRDLQDMQWRIQDYYSVNNKLPDNLQEAYLGVSAPEASVGRSAYEYNVLTGKSFELCADFAHPSQRTDTFARPVFEDQIIKNPDNWDHGEGKWCFERVVN